MEDTLYLRRVSVVEPVFIKVDGRSVCTRTWQEDADPELTIGAIVDVGGKICRVVDRATNVKNGACLITYEFSPIDRHADLAAWARESNLPQGKYLGHTEHGEQFSPEQ